MHQTMLFFTRKGRCYWLKCYEIPEGDKNFKGRAIQNMLNIEPDDSVNAMLRLRGLNDEEFVNSHYVVFATKNGTIKKTCLEAYSRPRTNGVNAINIVEGDEVVDVRLTNGKNEIILAATVVPYASTRIQYALWDVFRLVYAVCSSTATTTR